MSSGAIKVTRRRRWVVLFLWSMFGAGLLVEASAPNLKIANNAFVIPPSLMSRAGKTIRPAEIIARERSMQLLSAILTAGGALGLAICYRHVFIGTRPL